MENIILSKDQIARCYQEFFFNDDEEIIEGQAWYDQSNKQLHLIYEDAHGGADYVPNMSSPLDQKRLSFILNGKE